MISVLILTAAWLLTTTMKLLLHIRRSRNALALNLSVFAEHFPYSFFIWRTLRLEERTKVSDQNAAMCFAVQTLKYCCKV